MSTRLSLVGKAVLSAAALAAMWTAGAAGTTAPEASSRGSTVARVDSDIPWTTARTTPRIGSIVPTGASGLTPKERKALRIVSLEAIGIPDVGLLATARFAGNIERALGRGNLKTGLVALILHPKEASFETAIVATRRAGALGNTIAKTQSSAMGVVRNGRELSFFIQGPGFENVGEIELKTFATFPPTRGTASSSKGPTAEYWQAVVESIASTEARLPAPTAGTRCSDLEEMKSQVAYLIAEAERREAGIKELKQQLERWIPSLEDDLFSLNIEHAVNTLVLIGTSIATPLVIATGAPGAAGLAAHGAALAMAQGIREQKQILRDAIRSAKLDLRLADAVIELNRKLIEKLKQLQGKIDAFIAANCTISEDDTWTHNPPLGKSNVCINVRTTPVQAYFTVTLTGPGGFKAQSPGETPLVNGAGQFIATITKAGLFTKTINVYDERHVLTATVTKPFPVADPPQNGPDTRPPCPKPTQ